MKLTVKMALGAALALLSIAGAGMEAAQEYPTRPITVIIPFAGGSASDVVTRSPPTKVLSMPRSVR